MANFLLAKLGNHPTFVSAAVPHRIHPLRFNSYTQGQTYGVHVDAPIMSMPHSNEVIRSDMSATIFLTDRADYDGGEPRAMEFPFLYNIPQRFRHVKTLNKEGAGG
jgi:PKHD-type hydroxylase